MADPIEPVLLSEPTPWGVRLTLNRPAQAQRDQSPSCATR